jgi:membrane protease YdiL (CAAX protease family)
MFTQVGSFTKASLYYLIAITLAWLVALFGQGLGERSAILTMFTPLAAVLLMLLVVTRDGYTRAGWRVLGLHQTGWRSWGLAVLGPLLMLGCTYAIVWSTGIGRLDLTQYQGMINLLLSLLIGLIVSSLVALGEEIGWRGYLLPHLLALGRIRAMLLSGLLHGLWHLPLMLLTPFYHASGNRLIVVGLFLLTLTVAGVLYGYLRLTSGSVWPATLAHGALSTFWMQFAALTVATSSPLLLEYLAGESGLFSLLGAALLAGWLVYRWRVELGARQELVKNQHGAQYHEQLSEIHHVSPTTN